MTVTTPRVSPDEQHTQHTPDTQDGKGASKGLDWLLQDFLSRVPRTFGALLSSRDGLRLAVAGVEVDKADTLSAISSGLHALGRGLGELKSGRQGVRQILIEHDEVLLCVMAGGRGSLLSVAAELDADVRMIGHEMTRLVTRVDEHLAVGARADASASEAGV
ncbi:roadblock/LC7 domain-containing protein [Streptomyces sp. MAR4 CNY-716]